jgi:hypothetical protein
MITAPTPTPTTKSHLPMERPPVELGTLTRPQVEPTHRSWTLAYWLSAALAVAAIVASASGVVHPSLFRDPSMTAGNARGTDLVILAVAVPALILSMILAARGRVRAQIVWLGTLLYLVYNAAFFAFDVSFNQLFLVYVAVLSLAIWSLAAVLMRVDPLSIRACFTRGLPIRAISVYLLATTALFALAWLRDIVPALINGTTPVALQGTKMLTNPIQVMDFAFGFPLTILAAIWVLATPALGLRAGRCISGVWSD